MLLAAINDTAYDIVLILHIVAIVVAFAPATVSPVTIARVKAAEGPEAVARLSGYFLKNARTIHFPALVLAGVFGGMLIGFSDEAWQFDQAWIWLGIVVWLALCGVVSGILIPGERALAGGDADAEKRVAIGGQLATVLFLVQLYLMVAKPGL
ncbi:MAG: CopD family protein [Acidimicrobiia bacterium]|nr:CopD family protein [Acidimicrobiia bacterium]